MMDLTNAERTRPEGSLTAEIVYDDDGVVPRVLRLIGCATPAGGTASLEVTDEFLVVFDALLPCRVVEAVVVPDATSETRFHFERLFGVSLPEVGDGDVVAPRQGEYLSTVGRLALLDLLYRNGPLLSRGTLWLIERLALATSAQLAAQTTDTVLTLRDRLDSVYRIVERMGDDGYDLQLLASVLGAGEVPSSGVAGAACTSLRERLSTIDPILPRPEFVAEQVEVAQDVDVRGQYSLEWEQLPAGIVDPREGSIFAELDGRSGRVEVWAPLVLDRTPSTSLYARVWQVDCAEKRPVDDLCCTSFELFRQGRLLQGGTTDPRLIGLGVDDVIVEIASEPHGAYKSKADRARARGRRLTFWAGHQMRIAEHLYVHHSQGKISDDRSDAILTGVRDAIGRTLRQAGVAYEQAGLARQAQDAQEVSRYVAHAALALAQPLFLAELEVYDPSALSVVPKAPPENITGML